MTDWPGHTTGFAYDGSGNVLTVTYPNTTTASSTYNAADELTGRVDRTASGPVWTFGYGRDGAGKLSSAADPLQGVTHTYQYDALDRLTGDQAAAQSPTTFSYNAVHALTQLVDPSRPATTTLSYDGADQLSALSPCAGSLVYSFS